MNKKKNWKSFFVVVALVSFFAVGFSFHISSNYYYGNRNCQRRRTLGRLLTLLTTNDKNQRRHNSMYFIAFAWSYQFLVKCSVSFLYLFRFFFLFFSIFASTSPFMLYSYLRAAQLRWHLFFIATVSWSLYCLC